MSEIWTPESQEPEMRSISWSNLLGDESYGSRGRSSADIRITPSTALQSTVVLCCARIISETVAQCGLNVYRKTGSTKMLADGVPLNRILSSRPNGWQTKFEFLEQVCMNICLWGNSYTLILPGKYGSVSELHNLHPSNVTVERLENGRLRYSHINPQTARQELYSQDSIMHIRWTPEPDGLKGMVPIEVARDAIALARAQEVHASKYWANSARPGVVLTTEGTLSPESAEKLRTNWERLHQSSERAYRTAILTGGMKVTELGFTNEASQFVSSRNFQTEEIARVFRIPLHLLMGQSGGNLETQGQEFLTYTLVPWLSRIQSAISRSLITFDDEFVAEFDVSSLLKADSGNRASYYSTMLGLGILSINECRAKEGLSDLGADGDQHFVGMNQQTLADAAKPKPDPSQMPGAPQPAIGGVPSMPGVKTGTAPNEAEVGEGSKPQYIDAIDVTPASKKEYIDAIDVTPESRSDDGCGRESDGKFGSGNKCQDEGTELGSSPASSGTGSAPASSSGSSSGGIGTGDSLDVKKLLERISAPESEKGFTLDILTADQPETGIMVSTFQNDSVRSTRLPVALISTPKGAEMLEEFIVKNADQIVGRPDRFLGGWKDGDEFYLDIATRFEPEQAKEALEEARKAGQLAVFNLSTFKETYAHYEFDDPRKPKDWDSSFARARKDAGTDSESLHRHGRTSVRSRILASLEARGYNADVAEMMANAIEEVADVERRIETEIRAGGHSDQGVKARSISSVPGMGRSCREATGSGDGSDLVQGRAGGQASLVQLDSRGACGQDEFGHFMFGNDCAGESGGGLDDVSTLGSVAHAAPSAMVGGGGSSTKEDAPPTKAFREAAIKANANIKGTLGKTSRQDVMFEGDKTVAVIDREARQRTYRDSMENPSPPDMPSGSTVDLQDRNFVERNDQARLAKITSVSPVFDNERLVQSGSYVSHDAVGQYLSARGEEGRREVGGVGEAAIIDTREVLTPEKEAYLVKSLTADAIYAMKNARYNPGFYAQDLEEAMTKVSTIHPELATDADSRFVFKIATAILSNGQDPIPNLEQAEQVYSMFKKHGTVVTTSSIGGTRVDDVKKSLDLLQNMIDSFGVEKTRNLLSGYTSVENVNETLQSLSQKSGTKEWRERTGGKPWLQNHYGKQTPAKARLVKQGTSDEFADEVVPVASIFGPKIGAFFANLNGRHDFLTMDRWLMRTVGRNTGELVTRSSPQGSSNRAARALDALAANTSKEVLFGVEKTHGFTRAAIVRSLEIQLKTGVVEENGAAYVWATAAERAHKNTPKSINKKGEPTGSYGAHPKLSVDIAQRVGNSIFKDLIDEQQDPRNAQARRTLRGVFGKVRDNINKEFPDRKGTCDLDEVQAVLWQYEKNLWKHLGAFTKIDENSLYSAAADALIEKINSRDKPKALKPGKTSKRSVDMHPVDCEYSDTGYSCEETLDSGYLSIEQYYWDSEIAVFDVDFNEVLATIGRLMQSDSEQRAFCPTGDGGGVKNDCGDEDGVSPASSKTSSSSGLSKLSAPAGKTYSEFPFTAELKKAGVEVQVEGGAKISSNTVNSVVKGVDRLAKDGHRIPKTVVIKNLPIGTLAQVRVEQMNAGEGTTTGGIVYVNSDRSYDYPDGKGDTMVHEMSHVEHYDRIKEILLARFKAKNPGEEVEGGNKAALEDRWRKLTGFHDLQEAKASGRVTGSFTFSDFLNPAEKDKKDMRQFAWNPKYRLVSNGSSPLSEAEAIELAKGVSDYATTNPCEFVAEFRMKVMAGEKYSEETWKLYEAYGGPKLKEKRGDK